MFILCSFALSTSPPLYSLGEKIFFSLRFDVMINCIGFSYSKMPFRPRFFFFSPQKLSSKVVSTICHEPKNMKGGKFASFKNKREKSKSLKQVMSRVLKHHTHHICIKRHLKCLVLIFPSSLSPPTPSSPPPFLFFMISHVVVVVVKSSKEELIKTCSFICIHLTRERERERERKRKSQ